MLNPFKFGINITCMWSAVDMICLLCNNLIFNPILVKYNCSVKMNTTYVFNLKAITNSVGVGMALVIVRCLNALKTNIVCERDDNYHIHVMLLELVDIL